MQVEGKIQINNGQHCNCKCNHWGEENRKEKHTHYSQIQSSVLTGYGCKTA